MDYDFRLGESLFEVIYAENVIRMTVGQQNIFNIFAVEFADKLGSTFATVDYCSLAAFLVRHNVGICAYGTQRK